jgi:iron complex outermembrane recepter protein
MRMTFRQAVFPTLRIGARAAFLTVFSVSAASELAAQERPSGTFYSRTVILEFRDDGQAVFSNASGVLSAGTYFVVADTITFRDESGRTGCTGVRGRYLWRIDRDELQFRLVGDLCANRRDLLAAGWTRDAPSTGLPIALGAVVVTAQRQVEDVQRAPIVITVLSSDVLRDAGISRPQELTYLAPGLQVGALHGGNAMLYVRGVGSFAGNSLQDPSLTFNFDGVPVARPTATGGLFYDLERVEVLKGPQGTLYGRNTTGGAVNVLPRRPALGVTTGEVSADIGEYGTVRVDGAMNAPLGSRAAIRVAGQSVQHDGYMQDGTDDQMDRAGRLSLRLDATDALALRMVADYYHQGGRGPGSTPLATGVDNRFGVTSREGSAFYQSQRVTVAGRNWAPLPAAQASNNWHSGIHGTIDWRTNLGVLTFIPAQRRSHLDLIGSPAGNLLIIQERSRQNSMEARLASMPAGRVQTLVGVFYFDEAITTPAGGFFRPYNGFQFSLQQPASGVTSTAEFGRLTWHVTEHFRTTVGARHTRERKYFRGSYESFVRTCPPVPSATCPAAQPFPADVSTAPVQPTGVPVPNPADGTITIGFRILSDTSVIFSRNTWRAAVEHDLTEGTLAFASYETGFKAGGFFFSNDSQVYDPEYVGAFTLGVKSVLLQNRLQASVELFDWRYKDQQVSKFAVDSRNVTGLRTENIGRATIRGAATTVSYRAFTGTSLSADIELLRANLDSYVYVTPLSAGPPLSGCNVAQRPSGFEINCSGRRAPYAPERTLNVAAVQTFPLSRGASLSARIRTHHQSATLAGLDFLPAQEQRAYWTHDASLTMVTAADRYSVGVFVQNLTDRTIVSNTFVVPLSTFPIGVLRPPRIIGLRMTGRF